MRLEQKGYKTIPRYEIKIEGIPRYEIRKEGIYDYPSV